VTSHVRLALALLFLCLATALPAWGTKEKKQVEPTVAVPQTTIVQVTGVVRLVRIGPIPEVVISGADGEWHIAREDEHKLVDLQHETVTIEGEETITEIEFANGAISVTRRDLKNIRLIR